MFKIFTEWINKLSLTWTSSFSGLLILPFSHASPWDTDSGKFELSSCWHVNYHWTKIKASWERRKLKANYGVKRIETDWYYNQTGLGDLFSVPALLPAVWPWATHFTSQDLSFLLSCDIKISMTKGGCKNQMKMHTKVLVHCIGLEHRGSFLPFQRVATSISTYLWVSPAVFPGFSCLWCGQMLCQDWSLHHFQLLCLGPALGPTSKHGAGGCF